MIQVNCFKADWTGLEQEISYLIHSEGHLLGGELKDRADEGDTDVCLHDLFFAAGPADDGMT